jgi:hypothetical protein
MGRRIESQQKGLIEDKQKLLNPNMPSGNDLIFKLHLNPSAGEVTVIEFGLERVSSST